MKNRQIFIMIFFAAVMGLTMAAGNLTAPVYGAEVEIPSSFNPVGSGARALGMGGAFIAVADDATAASWNPGGLTQLKKPECSLVGAFYHRGEDLTFGTNPEADGSHSISDSNINYLSASYPFEAFNHNMIVSLSYQHLYDFNREWKFFLKEIYSEEDIYNNYWEYEQTGSMTALGFSYAIRVIPQFSIGVTLNFWDDDLTPNSWEAKYHDRLSGVYWGDDYNENISKYEKHSLRGFNFNLGFLWRINYKWTLGGVFKSRFNADVEHKFERKAIQESPFPNTAYENFIWDEEMEMPMSYGLGIVYNVSDHFSVSTDIYRTEWDDCIYRDYKGYETSPFTGRDSSQSDISPTHQIRIGGEYRFIKEEKGWLIPLRCGIFYDPAPAEGSPDDFYGFSLGLGFSKNDWFSLDISYQYRFGNDVGEALSREYLFSEDVDEHIVYLSVIWYKF